MLLASKELIKNNKNKIKLGEIANIDYKKNDLITKQQK
jgi:hypothetical protein